MADDVSTEQDLKAKEAALAVGVKQTILERWEITAEELTVAMDENPSLRGMLMGYVAEYKLRRLWFTDRPHVTHFVKHDDHNRKKKGDLVVTYKGRPFTVESKSLQGSMVYKVGDIWIGKAQVDGSDKRKVLFDDGTDMLTTCLKPGEFDILAVNLYSFTNEWRFVFAKNSDLPLSTHRDYTPAQQKSLLASLVPVSWPPRGIFRDEPFSLMDEMMSGVVAPRKTVGETIEQLFEQLKELRKAERAAKRGKQAKAAKPRKKSS